MKKFVVLCLTVMMALLVGCSSGETATKATENALKAIKSMDTEMTAKYFGSDVLNSEEKGKKSQELMAALIKNFSYEIVSVEETDASATAKIKLTNINLGQTTKDVFGEMLAEAMSSAFSGDGQQLSQEEIDKKTEKMFLEALAKPEMAKITSDVDLSLAKKDGAWTVNSTDAFIDAVLGGMISAVESMGNSNGSEAKQGPESKLNEIRNWLVGDIWNIGICDISHYLNNGKSSTGQTMDINFSVSELDKAMKKKQEYDTFMKELPDTYKGVASTWVNVSEQIDLLYGEIKASDLKPDGKGLDTGLYNQYFDAFDKAMNEAK